MRKDIDWMAKIKINPDKGFANDIRKQLKANNNY